LPHHFARWLPPCTPPSAEPLLAAPGWTVRWAVVAVAVAVAERDVVVVVVVVVTAVCRLVRSGKYVGTYAVLLSTPSWVCEE